MATRGRVLVRMVIMLVLVAMMTTNCGWMKRGTTGPRQHWWEFWKKKAPSTEFWYPQDDLTVTPPPSSPLVEAPGVPGGVSTLPIEQPVTVPDTGVALGGRTRKAPDGMVNELQMVHFAFDSFALDDAARQTLDRNAAFLLGHPTIKVLIEGHCDERGTVEYNLNLGERRAMAVREYLISKAVPAQQLEVISYGEERPLDPSKTETAHAMNRRAQFQIYLEY